MNETPRQDQAGKRPRRRGRWVWLCSGWLGGVLLCLGLLLLGAAWWISEIGLPDRLKQQLRAELRANGWVIEFSRLRWGWHRGIVAENLQLERTNAWAGPQIFAASAQCRINHTALRSLRLQVDSVRLQGGRLILPTTESARTGLLINDVEGRLRFVNRDLWELDNLEAVILGGRVKLSGVLTNASLLREWKLPRKTGKEPRPASAWWRRLVREAQQMSFAGTPELTGQFHADAGAFQRCEAELQFKVPAYTTPWGGGTNLLLTARLAPPANPEAETRVDIHLAAEEARTPWASAGSLQLEATLEPTLTRLLPTNSVLRIYLREAESAWVKAGRATITHQLLPCLTNTTFSETELTIQADRVECEGQRFGNAQLAARFLHPATNWVPARFSADAHVSQAQTTWARAREVEARLQGLLPAREQLRLFQTNLAWPERLAGLEWDASVLARQLATRQFILEQLALTNGWHGHELRTEGLGRLGQGELAVRTDLHPTTRDFHFAAASSVDPKFLEPLLGTNAQKILRNFTWQAAPTLEVEGRVVLPAWTNRAPDWRAQLWPAASLRGRLEAGPCGYEGVALEALQAPFALTNRSLLLPELVLTRLEGQASLAVSADAATGQFRLNLWSRLYPQAFQPLVKGAAGRRVFEFMQFTAPPEVALEAQGNWRDWRTITAAGRLEATNFTLRGEEVSRCQTSLRFTNLVIECVNPVVERPGERGTAPLVAIDLDAQKLYLHDAEGNLDPYALTRVIGEKTARAIAPYRFELPPSARANGVVDLKKGSHLDHLRFQVVGGQFHWEPFHPQALRGEVDWEGKRLTLSNVVAILHGGEVRGQAGFDFTPELGTDFSFAAYVNDVNLRALMRALNPSARTNKLEGALSGELQITHANTHDLKSWQGFGSVRLRDGLIWDIPVFGVFSPVLNAFTPGLGNSRAREGRANYYITNSIIHSKDLEIHATAMRMQFQGTVDFDQRINGRMEAELLRDVPGIGFFVSKVLWPVTKLFEYRMTGTLGEPKTEPLYLIPKIILLPLQPFKMLKDLMTPDSESHAPREPSQTN